MQHSRYAVDVPLSYLQQAESDHPATPSSLQNMQTVALNENAFNIIVNEIHVQEQATNQSCAELWASIGSAPDGPMAKQTGHSTEAGVAIAPSSLVSGPSNAQDASTGVVSSTESTVSPQPALPSPKTWQQSLIRGLAIIRALRTKNLPTTKSTSKTPTKIRSSSNLADYEAVLGIAPIWEGLKRLGRPDVDFTFAGLDVLCPTPGVRQGVGAVGRWSRFIMPLYFDSVSEEALERKLKMLAISCSVSLS